MLGAELLNASAQVIAARTGRMVQGLTDPAGQDLAELSLMTTEKTEALAAAAAALSVRAGAVGERLGQAALDEGARAMQAATEIACALTPAAAAQAQFRYALGWWSRAAGQTLTLSAELTQAQTAALTPIHQTAVAHANRLRKRCRVRLPPPPLVGRGTAKRWRGSCPRRGAGLADTPPPSRRGRRAAP